MRGFGRYSILNQEHARAAAEKNAAGKEREDAAREVTDRHLVRRDRDQPFRKIDRAEARPSITETFDPRPLRPEVANAPSVLLPNGPTPGVSAGGHTFRRVIVDRQTRDRDKAATAKAAATVRAESGNSSRTVPNRVTQALLNREAKVEAEHGQKPSDKDKNVEAQIDDD